MNIEILKAEYTDYTKRQFLATLKITDITDENDQEQEEVTLPYYVSLDCDDDAEIYQILKSKFDSGELIPEENNDCSIIEIEVREKRNNLLSETDHLIMPDYPLDDSIKKQICTYRQDLRDITKQEGFPQNIVWPEKPVF